MSAHLGQAPPRVWTRLRRAFQRGRAPAPFAPAATVRRRARRPHGQAIVELALVAPVLLLLFASALDLGRLFYSKITVANAAREGAIEAALNPSSFQANAACPAGGGNNRVMCRVLHEATSSWVTVAPADVALSCNPVSCAPGIGNSVTVTVTGHFQLVTGILAVFTGGQNISFSSSATAQIATQPAFAGPTATPTATPTPVPTATPTATPSGTPTATPTATATATPACFAPVANFTFTTPGQKTVNFTDTSTNMSSPGCNNVWSWNFGDGSGSSSQPNPTYTYKSSSSKNVTLTVSNNAGSSNITKTVNP